MKGLNYQNAERTAEAQRESFTFGEGAELFISMTANSGDGKLCYYLFLQFCAVVEGIRKENQKSYHFS